MRNGLLFLPSALLSQEKEARNDAEHQSSQPSENEVALHETVNSLQQEKEAITAQYQAQVCFTCFLQSHTSSYI